MSHRSSRSHKGKRSKDVKNYHSDGLRQPASSHDDKTSLYDHDYPSYDYDYDYPLYDHPPNDNLPIDYDAYSGTPKDLDYVDQNDVSLSHDGVLHDASCAIHGRNLKVDTVYRTAPARGDYGQTPGDIISAFDTKTMTCQEQEESENYNQNNHYYTSDRPPWTARQLGVAEDAGQDWSPTNDDDYHGHDYGSREQKIGSPSGADWFLVSVRPKGSKKWVDVKHKYDTGNETGLHLITERLLYNLGFARRDIDTTAIRSFTAFGQRIVTMGAIHLSLRIRDMEHDNPTRSSARFHVVNDNMSSRYDLVFTGDESQSFGEFLMTGFGHTKETPEQQKFREDIERERNEERERQVQEDWAEEQRRQEARKEQRHQEKRNKKGKSRH